MSFTSTTRSVLIGIKSNLSYLCIRAAGLIVRVAPCKVFLIQAMGIAAGLLTACAKIRQWRPIAEFGRRIGSPLPSWRFILRYFLQGGKDGVWTHLYYEAPGCLKKYITVENIETLQNALREGHGAVLLGAHYGPWLSRFALYKSGVHARQLVNAQGRQGWQGAARRALRFLVPAQLSFLMDSRLTLAAGTSERELVRHLRSGGVVYMLVDFPRERSGGFSADLLGRRMSFNSFPFKLALRYDAPVFFVCMRRSGNGGYRLSVEPLGPFETPDEGGSKYVSRLQTRLAAYPFMWLFLPNFTGWFSDAPRHDPPRRSGPVAP